MEIKAVSVQLRQASVRSWPSGVGERPGEHTVSLTWERACTDGANEWAPGEPAVFSLSEKVWSISQTLAK